MKEQFDYENEFEKIAADLIDEVCLKFVNNEDIKLDMTRKIQTGPVFGYLSYEDLNDQYNTVVHTYCVIDRSEIVLDKKLLHEKIIGKYLRATENSPNMFKNENLQKLREHMRYFAEFHLGAELKKVFSGAAQANPEKYPKYNIHGHATGKKNKDKPGSKEEQ